MEKSKLASFGERLKTQGAQMGRMMSSKMKDLLQTPTLESKMVEEATSDALPEPNWGVNLRICAMINSEEFSGTEVVRAIKRKMSVRSASAESQRLCLELLDACAMNCDKVFSEVASEKVVEEMVRMIDSPQVDAECKRRAWEMIRAWGESPDLTYLPVFRQTYASLKNRVMPPPLGDGNSSPMGYSLESFVHEQPLPPPGNYPIPSSSLQSPDNLTLPYNYGSLSGEEKKEFVVMTRNSLELLSTMLNSGAEQNTTQDEVMVSLLEKCKQSLPALQRIIETTSDDEEMLFEALNLHDELQQVISKREESGAVAQSGEPHETSPGPDAALAARAETLDVAVEAESERVRGVGRDKLSEAHGARIEESPKEQKNAESAGSAID